MALFFDALENMKSFVSSVSQFEECLRSEEDIKEDIKEDSNI